MFFPDLETWELVLIATITFQNMYSSWQAKFSLQNKHILLGLLGGKHGNE